MMSLVLRNLNLYKEGHLELKTELEAFYKSYRRGASTETRLHVDGRTMSSELELFYIPSGVAVLLDRHLFAILSAFL